MTWHIARGSEKRGPISESNMTRLVEAGRVRPTDKVWRAGMSEWKPAGDVPGLFTPPAASEAPSTPPFSPTTTSTQGNSLGDYLLAHWQGRHSLARSFWINGVAFGIAYHVISWLLIGAAVAMAPGVGGLVAVIYFILGLALIVWQPVGLYRSAIACIRTPERTSNFWPHISLIYAASSAPVLPLLAVAIIGGVSALGSNANATFNDVAAEMSADGHY